MEDEIPRLTGGGFIGPAPTTVELNGIAALAVTQLTATSIRAVLPPNLAQGSYLLTVGYGTKATDFDEFWISLGAVGAQGPQGASGPQGAKGETGAMGPAGSQGPPGAQGIAGPVGPAGPEGPAGPQGLQGPQGVPGASGVTGINWKICRPDPLAPNFPRICFCDAGDKILTGGADCGRNGDWLITSQPAFNEGSNSPRKEGWFATCGNRANYLIAVEQPPPLTIAVCAQMGP